LKSYIEERAVELANYIVENKATVRATSANQFRPGRAGKGGIGQK